MTQWLKKKKKLPAEKSVQETKETWVWSGSGRFPGGEKGNPFQYSWLENPMNRGAWQTTVHGVAKSWTWKSEWAHVLWVVSLYTYIGPQLLQTVHGSRWVKSRIKQDICWHICKCGSLHCDKRSFEQFSAWHRLPVNVMNGPKAKSS